MKSKFKTILQDAEAVIERDPATNSLFVEQAPALHGNYLCFLYTSHSGEKKIMEAAEID